MSPQLVEERCALLATCCALFTCPLHPDLPHYLSGGKEWSNPASPLSRRVKGSRLWRAWLDVADPCQQNCKCICEYSVENKKNPQRCLKSLLQWHIILDGVLGAVKLSADRVSDCYLVKDVCAEVVYFFPAAEVCSTFPSLSETLSPADLRVPHKQELLAQTPLWDWLSYFCVARWIFIPILFVISIGEPSSQKISVLFLDK